MAGTPIGVIKKWIGHASDRDGQSLRSPRPDFMQNELERVPDFITKIAPQIGMKNAEFAPVDPHGNVAA